eukprot:2211110-Alexandrium_andersonii.AAC.1
MVAVPLAKAGRGGRGTKRIAIDFGIGLGAGMILGTLKCCARVLRTVLTAVLMPPFAPSTGFR